jgi:hypothetical protein
MTGDLRGGEELRSSGVLSGEMLERASRPSSFSDIIANHPDWT